MIVKFEAFSLNNPLSSSALYYPSFSPPLPLSLSPSVRITINQFDDSPLDQLPLDMSPPSQSDCDDDEFDVKVPHSKPSPFSQKKDYFSGLGKVNV